MYMLYAYRLDQSQCLISYCMLSEMSLMPQGVVAIRMSSGMAHFALKCSKTDYGMLGERGLGLAVHIPSGHVAKINIP